MSPLQWVLTAIGLSLLGLLALVIVVGLLNGTLDTTGAATMIGGVLTGAVGALIVTVRKP